MVFRFAVGEPDGRRSSAWKLWGQGEDAYLLQRNTTMKKVHKFSFHKSGICNWAQIDERPDGLDRAMLKWRRDPIPEVGYGQGCRLLSLAFPTNHLSSEEDENADHWIKPAASGRAFVVEISLTREDETTIKSLFGKRNDRELAYCQRLRNGANLYAAILHFDCGPVDLQMPAKPVRRGQIFGDLEFPADRESSGRPVRMLMPSSQPFPPIVVWELSGYSADRAEG
jgi:hypothetical protein